MECIMEKFIEQLKESLEIENRDVLPEDKFREFEEWDSLANLSLLAMISDEYNTSLPRGEIDKAKTVEELYELIQKYQ
jgi:acyl carrier protein